MRGFIRGKPYGEHQKHGYLPGDLIKQVSHNKIIIQEAMSQVPSAQVSIGHGKVFFMSAISDNAQYDLLVHSDDKAILAYIDLCGTKSLYDEQTNSDSLKTLAENLFNTLLEKFFDSLQSIFSDTEITNDFYINIYADSIMICVRKREDPTIKKLVEFFLSYQLKLIEDPIFATHIQNETVPFRAILARGPYFSLHLNNISKDHILNSPYLDVSLCGGKGMVGLDKRLSGLPIGVYIEECFMKDSQLDADKVLRVKDENLFFVKQDSESIIELLTDEELTKACKGEKISLTDRGRFNHEKWDQWIRAHNGEIVEITRNCKLYSLLNIFLKKILRC